MPKKDTSHQYYPDPLSPEDKHANRSDQKSTTDLLNYWGVPPERHEAYLAEVQGLIAIALDAYFQECEDGVFEKVAPNDVVDPNQ